MQDLVSIPYRKDNRDQITIYIRARHDGFQSLIGKIIA